eukprot:TRINITY_DN13838_c0_g1_i1.p1 TRINITY_DN13838_c0_g1~~TRINITY_DN13838_c0_g1_i1.p1  ORF type:complete len:318 (-),score=18.66 TRINITY_DN13838_c0_g1_i1:21-974(-)
MSVVNAWISAVVRWWLFFAVAVVRCLVSLWSQARDFIVFTTESPVNSRTIELEKAFLSKLPVHIGFILNAADWSTPDVAKLLSWCASLGIQHITIFDQHGVIKQRKEDIVKSATSSVSELGSEKPRVFEVAQDIHSHLSDSSAIRKHIQEYLSKTPAVPTDAVLSNQTVRSRSKIPEKALLDSLTVFEGTPDLPPPGVCRVMFASGEDAHSALLTATRQIASACCAQPSSSDSKQWLQSEAISQGLIHDLLNRHDGQLWPPPDFTISYEEGPFMSGFLPWHLRYSEVFLAGRQHNFSWAKLRDPLRSFAKCVQRFGK